MADTHTLKILIKSQTKARGITTTVHVQVREDIMSPHAIGALSAGAVSAMSAVGAAVIKKKQACDG